MIHDWSFVIASYGLAFVCVSTLSVRAVCRYRRAVRRMTHKQSTSVL